MNLILTQTANLIRAIKNNHEELEMIIYDIIEKNSNINITNDTIFFNYKAKLFILNISVCSKYYNLIIT